MLITDLLGPDAVVSPLRAATRTHVLLDVSRIAARITGLSWPDVFKRLREREHEGSTCVDRGVAIPHARFEVLDRCRGVLARLHRPVDFGAVDNQPVDIVFVLLAPTAQGGYHLTALACISRLLRDDATVARLRGTRDRRALYAICTEPPASCAT